MSEIRFSIVIAVGLLLVPQPSWSLRQEPAPQQQDATSAAVSAALLKFEQGDPAGAITDLEALRQAPDTPVAVSGILGALYVEAGEMDKAMALLKPIAESEASNPAVLYNAGRAAVGLGEIEVALDYLGRATQQAPSSPAARELGLLLGGLGNFADAYALLRPWSLANPDDRPAVLASAMGAVQLNRVPEAEELLSQLDATDPGVKLLWGQLLLLKNDPWGAIGYLEPMLEDADPALERDVRRLLANAYLAVGESAEAIKALEGHVDENPVLAVQLSRARFQNGQLDEAIAGLEPFAQRALQAPPEAAEQPENRQVISDLCLEFGGLLNVSGRNEDALPYLRRHTELQDESKIGWQNLGQALAATGNTEEAQRALERFQELSIRDESETLNRRERDLEDPTGRELRAAMELVAQGDGEEALRKIRREAELAPNDLRPRLGEVRALVLLERAAEAMETADILVSSAPENADAHFVRGSALMALKRLEEAESALRKALDLSPDHTAAMNDLAVLLMDADRDQEATALLEAVLELQPNDALARTHLERIRGPQ